MSTVSVIKTPSQLLDVVLASLQDKVLVDVTSLRLLALAASMGVSRINLGAEGVLNLEALLEQIREVAGEVRWIRGPVPEEDTPRAVEGEAAVAHRYLDQLRVAVGNPDLAKRIEVLHGRLVDANKAQVEDGVKRSEAENKARTVEDLALRTKGVVDRMTQLMAENGFTGDDPVEILGRILRHQRQRENEVHDFLRRHAAGALT